MERGVKLDKWGYEVTTSSQPCISAINAYYNQVLSYGRKRCVILEAVGHDKDCVLANTLAAHFLHSSDPSRASSFLQAAKSQLDRATLYENLVFDVISYLVSRDRDDEVACELHSKLLKEFPRDLVSLKRAQVLYFYTGRPDLSLSLVLQVLPENEGKSYVYGMLAFPLLELGHMKDAEEAAKRGYEINKHDIWAQHALCHVFQYQCRFMEAVRFMEGCSSSWSSCSSFMLTHNWWHVALCYLEGNAPMKRVLEVYDHHIWKELDKADAVSTEVYLNAAGLLLRLSLRGEMESIEGRLKILAECLTDQEMVAPMVDENESYRGRSEWKDEIPLSELLDLEIRWPSEAERTLSGNSDLPAFPGQSSLNLAGVDLDSFFYRKESDSDMSELDLASGRNVGAASDNTFQGNENRSLFQNVQASDQSGDSFSGWEANFKSASSGPVIEESKSVDHSRVELDTVSRYLKDSVGVKNDDFNPSASGENDWFQGGGWRTSNSEVHNQSGTSETTVDINHTKTAETANGSSTRNLDWMQDGQWQGSDNKTPDNVATDGADDSFDAWNDFTGSVSTRDPSGIVSSPKITDQTGKSGFSADLNDTKTAEGANSSSNGDFSWMQDDQWQDNNNKTTDNNSANEAADSFDAWNDFTGSANTQYSSHGVSNSEATGQTGKFEFTKDPIDAITTESATGSSSNFDWMQNDQWQGSNNKATGNATTNEVTDSFDAWNDFTGSAISQNPSSSVSHSEITGQTGKSEIIADLSDTKAVEGANASSVKSFDWMQDDAWQVSNNKTNDTVTTNDTADSFDVWNDFTSSTTAQDPLSNVWKQTANQTYSEKTSETNLFGSSNTSHDMDFSGSSQHDLFSGQFNNPLSSPAATNALPVAASSNRVADVDTTRGSPIDVSTAEVGSKDDVEMLMSQMHDLSFMLENNLSFPPK